MSGGKIMANCPKCGEHLRLLDWRQLCPHCGANIVLYDLQERLMQEADKAEVQHYHFQKKIDRLKTAFIGSKLTVVRIFTSLIPILALLLPLVSINAAAPLKEFSGGISAITLYQMSENIDFSVLSELFSSPQGRAPMTALLICAVMLALSLLVLFIRFVCLTMACSPKGKIRNYSFDIALLVFVVVAMISFLCIPENSFISGSLNVGAFVLLGLMLLNFIVDILVFRENIEIKHAQVYVGGIPIEEYFEMLERGAPQAEIRADMYARLAKLQREKDEVLKAESEAEAKKEKEKEEAKV